MTYILRPYQQAMSDLIVRHLTSGRSKPFIVQAATGAGKSLVIADVCHRLEEPVLILQPTKELLEQNYAKLEAYGITDISVYSASAGRKEIGQFTFATIGSIHRKPELFSTFKHVIVDECDVVNPKNMTGMYQNFFKALGVTNIVGLTATPYRIETKYEYKGGMLYANAALKMITRIGHPTFWNGGIASKIETSELIEQGYLSPIRYRADSEELHGLVVNSTGADYTTASLERWGNTKVDRLADYCVYVEGKCKRNLVFCTSVAQAHKLEVKLLDAGLNVGVVTADTPAKEREELVTNFRSGKITHMLNVGVFLAGFDVPELDCIIFARPTLSPRVWYQAVGRGVRLDPASPDKILRVFDLSGALRRLGKVEAIQLGHEKSTGRDALYSEAGRLDDKALYSFKINR